MYARWSTAVALTASKPFSFRVESATEEFISTGQAIDLHAEGQVVVRRPNGLFVDKVSDARHRRLYFEGATEVEIDGVKYFKLGDVLYKPVFVDGDLMYKVTVL